MISIITTVDFELEHVPDQLRTRIVAQLPHAADDELQRPFKERFGARWSREGKQVEFEFRYALAVSASLKRAGIIDVELRPKHPQLPLEAIVDQAASTARMRADWPVSAVEIVEERVDHRFGDDYGNLVFLGCFVARVSQSKP